ncbi:MAG TPA: TraR/DksA C4-type zinc finger protein [Candidatus Acidoferrum sp.]|nr:TraR/DksA C4-type zinc finger protein [Candidatus Acidoferrum sp.]
MEKEKKSEPVSNRTRATAAQILGGGGGNAGKTAAANGNIRVPAKWSSHYESLVSAQTQILRHKDNHADMAKEEQAAFSLHMADAGTDEFDRDFALSLMSSEQNALFEIEQALTRMRNGTYGVCEVTGEEIEAERLAAVPWARYSTQAQLELEASGSVHRTQFGRRGSLTTSESSTASDDDGDEAEAPAANAPSGS